MVNASFFCLVLFVAYRFQVNKIEIQYAKTAEKMDMKKLKQSMWSLLTKIPRRADAEVTGSPRWCPAPGRARLAPVLQRQEREPCSVKQGRHQTSEAEVDQVCELAGHTEGGADGPFFFKMNQRNCFGFIPTQAFLFQVAAS